MATIVKRTFSGASNGRGIAVSATAGAAPILIHTGASSTSISDEVWLYAQNNFSATVELRIEMGTTSTGVLVTTTVPPKAGLQTIIPGLLLQNSASNDAITAHIGGLNGSASPAGGLVSVFGFVNRITQ